LRISDKIKTWSRFQLTWGTVRRDPTGLRLGRQRSSGIWGYFPIHLLLEAKEQSILLSRKRSRRKKKSAGKTPSY